MQAAESKVRRPVAARAALEQGCVLLLESLVSVANGCCLLFGVDGDAALVEGCEIQLHTSHGTFGTARLDVEPGPQMQLRRA